MPAICKNNFLQQLSWSVTKHSLNWNQSMILIDYLEGWS